MICDMFHWHTEPNHFLLLKILDLIVTFLMLGHRVRMICFVGEIMLKEGNHRFLSPHLDQHERQHYEYLAKFLVMVEVAIIKGSSYGFQDFQIEWFCGCSQRSDDGPTHVFNHIENELIPRRCPVFKMTTLVTMLLLIGKNCLLCNILRGSRDLFWFFIHLVTLEENSSRNS